MDVYLIGDPTQAHQRIGVSRNSRDTLAEMQAQNAPGLELHAWDDMDTGRATLVLRAFEIRCQRFNVSPDWFLMPRADAIGILEAIITDVDHFASASERRARPELAALMLHLRQDVFRTTQKTMGAICGRPEVYISRWEAGAGTPGLEELLRIREAALSLGLPWDDTAILDRTRDLKQEDGRHGK